MINKQFLNTQNFLLLIVILFSISINQYYGNKGIFPIESTAYFDTAYRILQGDIPFKDYWLVSGMFIDYVQTVFFWLFGINFQVYIFHASLINCLIAGMTFFFVKEIKLGNNLSFFYAITFSVLAYTTSGTLYVDNHASLLCLAAIYLFIFGVKNGNKKNFFFIPVLIGFAFLTKSAPTIYVFLLFAPVLLLYIFLLKKFELILLMFFSSIIFLFVTFLFIFYQGIPLNLFLEQYFYFPMTIANNRYENLLLSFQNIIFNFKFVYFFLIPLIILNIYKFYSVKKYFLHSEFFIFLSILILSFGLMFHQMNTQNQLFILFLIPLLCSFLHSELVQMNMNKKKLINNLLIIICIFFTVKYHLRYNEGRKFHEMQNVDFNLAVDAGILDKKLDGLSWISPSYKEKPMMEIELLKKTIINLKENNQKKMIISNYSFLSSLLDQNLNSPSRWYISNGAAYPVKNNKYFKNYRNYLIGLILNKEIEAIYVIKPVASKELFRYVNPECFTSNKINLIVTKYEYNKSCNL